MVPDYRQQHRDAERVGHHRELRATGQPAVRQQVEQRVADRRTQPEHDPCHAACTSPLPSPTTSAQPTNVIATARALLPRGPLAEEEPAADGDERGIGVEQHSDDRRVGVRQGEEEADRRRAVAGQREHRVAREVGARAPAARGGRACVASTAEQHGREHEAPREQRQRLGALACRRAA